MALCNQAATVTLAHEPTVTCGKVLSSGCGFRFANGAAASIRDNLSLPSPTEVKVSLLIRLLRHRIVSRLPFGRWFINKELAPIQRVLSGHVCGSEVP
jgi:hypothetical protein